MSTFKNAVLNKYLPSFLFICETMKRDSVNGLTRKSFGFCFHRDMGISRVSEIYDLYSTCHIFPNTLLPTYSRPYSTCHIFPNTLLIPMSIIPMSLLHLSYISEYPTYSHVPTPLVIYSRIPHKMYPTSRHTFST
jgi:hypothetical protein